MTSYEQVKRDAGHATQTLAGWVLGAVLIACAWAIIESLAGAVS